MGDVDTQVELVEKIRHEFPHLTIFARARDRRAGTRLLRAGVDHVYRETLDSGVRMGADMINLLGGRRYQTERFAQTFRAHDERHFREAADLAGEDHRIPISAARERLELLERTLADDLDEHLGERDRGWDTESLRSDTRLRDDVS